MHRLSVLFSLMLSVLLAACGGGSSTSAPAQFTLPSYMRQGFETYGERGTAARPGNAVDVFIVYSPESQQYMPRIIAEFNRLSAAGTNPATGQPWGDQAPAFVSGQQPTTGSSGSVAQGVIDAIINPSAAQVYHPTIYQPSVSTWLDLVNDRTGQPVFDLAAAQATANTPVVIGIWESLYNALVASFGPDIGWQDLLAVLNSPNGWADFGVDNGRRAVFYGHADPNTSSTGLSATISVYSACASLNGFTDRRLTDAAVTNSDVTGCVRNVENLVRHYARRTEDFLPYIERGPDFLDMVALEETDLVCLNRGGVQGDQQCRKPAERLIAIYPEDGTFMHEHPFGIVNASWVTEAQKTAARTFTDFVLTPDMQRIIMSEGFRPANPAVPLEFPLTAQNGIDPAKPTALLFQPATSVIRQIQGGWQLVKKPADIMILVDTSGSMDSGDKLDTARVALTQFISEMNTRNRVGLATFSDRVQVWVPLAPVEQNIRALNLFISCQGDGSYQPPLNALYGRCLQAEGSTSLYTGLRTALDITDIVSEPDRIRAILLVSDGQDTCDAQGCATLNAVLTKIAETRKTVNPVVIIPVAYGADADTITLSEIARVSFTTLTQGDTANIAALLNLIGGYF